MNEVDLIKPVTARATLELCRDAITLTVFDFQEKHNQPHPLTDQGALIMKKRITEALDNLEDWIPLESGCLPERTDGRTFEAVLLYVPEWTGMDPVTTGRYYFAERRFVIDGGLQGIPTQWRKKPQPPK